MKFIVPSMAILLCWTASSGAQTCAPRPGMFADWCRKGTWDVPLPPAYGGTFSRQDDWGKPPGPAAHPYSYNTIPSPPTYGYAYPSIPAYPPVPAPSYQTQVPSFPTSSSAPTGGSVPNLPPGGYGARQYTCQIDSMNYCVVHGPDGKAGATCYCGAVAGIAYE